MWVAQVVRDGDGNLVQKYLVPYHIDMDRYPDDHTLDVLEETDDYDAALTALD